MGEEFLGFERPKGLPGIRNKIAVISSVVCVNRVAQQIATKIEDGVAIFEP
jgi:altronate dehydratase